MKISKRKLRLCPIIIILILNATFFYVEPIAQIISPINDYHNKLLIVIFSLLLFMIYTIQGHFQKFGRIDLVVISFIIIVVVIFILQTFDKEDSFVNLFSNMYFFLIFLLYFPLKRIINENKDDFFKILIYTGLIYTLSNLLIFLYLKSGHTYSYSLPLIQYVDSRLRLPQSADIVGFSFVITLYYFYKTENSKLRIFFILFLMAMELIFVAQVRMMLVAVTISSCVIIYFFYKQRHKNIKIILILITTGLILIASTYFLFTRELGIIEIFLGKGQRFESAMYRFEEIKHYSEYMFMNFIFGFGFTQQPHIISYALTDIGIFAFIFRYGITGILWLFNLIQTFIQSSKFVKDKALYYGLISFFSITFISLSIFDPQRVVIFPILFALVNSTIDNRHN